MNFERDKTLKSKKRQLEIMSNLINAEWGIMLNGKKRRLEIIVSDRTDRGQPACLPRRMEDV
jgi:hypothetical protein